jgi:hypothetical protein
MSSARLTWFSKLWPSVTQRRFGHSKNVAELASELGIIADKNHLVNSASVRLPRIFERISKFLMCFQGPKTVKKVEGETPAQTRAKSHESYLSILAETFSKVPAAPSPKTIYDSFNNESMFFFFLFDYLFLFIWVAYNLCFQFCQDNSINGTVVGISTLKNNSPAW